MAIRTNMEQVGNRGELDASQFQATMLAASMGTVHDGKFNNKYAWETCRRENADIMIPTGVVQLEDIHWQWVTHEKLNQFITNLKVRSPSYFHLFQSHIFFTISFLFSTMQATYLKFKFAINEPEQLSNGKVAEITMSKLLAPRHIVFDETEFRLGNDRDVGGTWSGTYANSSLNCGGARSTHSNRHVTGGLAVTAAGEFLPPLIIYSTSAEKEENYAANNEWIVRLGITKGKYGHDHFIERLPYIAVRKVGSMDITLFMDFVKNATFDLYPEETVSLEIKIDEYRRLVCGPVMWNMDTGPGRLTSIDGPIGEVWDEWAKNMMQRGVILNGLLSNSTSVSAVMDELFRKFKIATRASTQKHFAKKIKKNAK